MLKQSAAAALLGLCVVWLTGTDASPAMLCARGDWNCLMQASQCFEMMLPPNITMGKLEKKMCGCATEAELGDILGCRPKDDDDEMSAEEDDEDDDADDMMPMKSMPRGFPAPPPGWGPPPPGWMPPGGPRRGRSRGKGPGSGGRMREMMGPGGPEPEPEPGCKRGGKKKGMKPDIMMMMVALKKMFPEKVEIMEKCCLRKTGLLTPEETLDFEKLTTNIMNNVPEGDPKLANIEKAIEMCPQPEKFDIIPYQICFVTTCFSGVVPELPPF